MEGGMGGAGQIDWYFARKIQDIRKMEWSQDTDAEELMESVASSCSVLSGTSPSL
jgi:hypothetical protein